MRRAGSLLATLTCLMLMARVPAEAAPVPFKEFRLKNGLRLIVSEDHSSPTFSTCLTYNAGSRDEKPGQTGLARLIQEMMFQGSENVGLGEHWQLVQANGGFIGVATEPEKTVYFQTLTANHLDLGLFLEADRMRSLNWARFEAVRNILHSQLSSFMASAIRTPDGVSELTQRAVLKNVYTNTAYNHTIIGFPEELKSITADAAAKFHKSYYAPNNAVLAVVGDVHTDEVVAKARKYFEDISEQPPPPEPDLAEPEQKEERRQTLRVLGVGGKLNLVYKVPAAGTPDWYALSLLMRIMTFGTNTRIYQKLVKEEGVATSIYGWLDERRGPSLAVFQLEVPIVAGPPPNPEPLFNEEIERVKNVPVTLAEMEAARVTLRRQHANNLLSTRTRAMMFGQYALYHNDPDLINRIDEKYAKVTQEDIQRAAKLYLNATNRTVVNVVFDWAIGSPNKPASSPENNRR